MVKFTATFSVATSPDRTPIWLTFLKNIVLKLTYFFFLGNKRSVSQLHRIILLQPEFQDLHCC